MKKIMLLLLVSLTGFVIIRAQAPAFLNYQGVARNSVGNVLSNKALALRLTIHDGSATGTTVYSETRVVTTNPFGLFNVQTGSSGAIAQTGSISTVAWPTGRKFIEVEIDPDGSNNFLKVGTTELASVPFSLYAEDVAKIRGVNVTTTTPTVNYVLGFNGSSWTPTDMANHPSTYWRLNGNNIYNTNTSDVNRIHINGATGSVSIGGGPTVPEKLFVNGTVRIAASSANNAIAVFENTSTSDSADGIVIKINRTHPRWNGSAYANIANPVTQGVETQVNQIRDWIYGNDTFSWDDLIDLLPSQYLTGTICNLTNLITSNINSALSLPLRIGPYSTPSIYMWGPTTVFGGLTMPPGIPDIPSITIPGLTIPSVQVMPQVTVMPRIPEISCGGLPTLAFPVFQFTDVSNSLSKENEFITFRDKDNRKLGAIRAQSVEDFSYDYFDGQKLLDLAAEFIGIDIVDDFMSIAAGISQMVKDYNQIGIEYSSGNGDYAEWLEREDPKETISFGDIVGVKGGRITRNLEGAEQIMAVSKKPIVLGNLPDKDRVANGNNIAFMGQIPVKVIGAVKAGDYIVARGEVPGYGVAIHPKDMTVADYKLAVGRSWDTNEKGGPKMVNTVVGVHNHDFLNIISNLQQKAENNDQRLKMIEQMLKIPAGNTESQPAKKAFK
jgi:hypothetical protein